MFATWFFGDPCMKLVTTLATMAALVSLGGCNRAPSSGQSASAEKANNQPAHSSGPNAIRASATGLPAHNAGPNGQGLANNPNAIPASSTLTPSVDRAFLIGRWTDGRDCHEAGQFSADGRYTNTAGQNAAWTLEGSDAVSASSPKVGCRTPFAGNSRSSSARSRNSSWPAARPSAWCST